LLRGGSCDPGNCSPTGEEERKTAPPRPPTSPSTTAERPSEGARGLSLVVRRKNGGFMRLTYGSRSHDPHVRGMRQIHCSWPFSHALRKGVRGTNSSVRAGRRPHSNIEAEIALGPFELFRLARPCRAACVEESRSPCMRPSPGEPRKPEENDGDISCLSSCRRATDCKTFQANAQAGALRARGVARGLFTVRLGNACRPFSAASAPHAAGARTQGSPALQRDRVDAWPALEMLNHPVLPRN